MTAAVLGVLIVAYVVVGARAARRLWTATRDEVRARSGITPNVRAMLPPLAPWLFGCAIWPLMTAYALMRRERR